MVTIPTITHDIEVALTWASGGWILYIEEDNPMGLKDEYGNPSVEFMPHVFTSDEALLDFMKSALPTIRSRQLKFTCGLSPNDPDDGIPKSVK